MTIVHDLNRKIFFINEKAADYTGLKPRDVIGRDCHDVFQNRLCGENCSFCDTRQIQNFENKRYSTVLRSPHRDKKELEATVIPLKMIDGTMRGVMLSLKDNTRLKSLEQRLTRETSFRGIIGRDYQMKQVFQQIRDVAMYDYPVYIHGETGVGKELVARAIHDESTRGTSPFVPINCGALPEGLVESELFGHVKGAFSGRHT